MDNQLESDVVIIGAGITGAAIAKELSRYKVDTIIVEKSETLNGYGQTKGSSGQIYQGLQKLLSMYMKSLFIPPGQPIYEPGSFTEQLETDGFRIWHEEWLDQLDIEHTQVDCLMVATKEQLPALETTWNMGQELGGTFAEIERIDRDYILEKEPNLSKDIVAGIRNTAYSASFTYPWELTFALLDNAQQNGVKIIRGAQVLGVSRNGNMQTVHTAKGDFSTKFIVNAAGAEADRIGAMGGEIDWEVQTFRAALFILDKQRSAELVSGKNMITPPPRPGWMEFVYPTLSGNLVLNCSPFSATKDRDMVEVTREDYELGLPIARRLISSISENDIIRSWSVSRAYHSRNPEDHIIEPCSTNPGFINAKVRAPGIKIAPAVAQYVLQLLGNNGLALSTKANYNPTRKAIPRFRDLSEKERKNLISEDSRYGHVVCRCETVTEGEIVEAIKRGARTLQEVKYRTRAGMGRCQAGFCLPRVVGIIARELDIPVTHVFDRNAPVLPFQSKELHKMRESGLASC